jgi:LmbE family N-acetylglucosaminyl deacetylase
MRKRILTIFAHPDDAEAIAGGTLLISAQEGAAITLCLVTNGDKGSHDPTAKQEDIVAQRRQEQEKAAALLGAELLWLGLEDGLVQPTLSLRRELVRVIRQVRPQVVITHDPTVWFRHGHYINHPDHRAVGQATVEALYPAVKKASIFPELAAAGLPPHVPEELWLAGTDTPNRWVDVAPVLEQKLALLTCHASQFPPAQARVVFTGLAAEEGRAAGLAYAEAFRVISLGPRTVDLLARHWSGQ